MPRRRLTLSLSAALTAVLLLLVTGAGLIAQGGRGGQGPQGPQLAALSARHISNTGSE